LDIVFVEGGDMHLMSLYYSMDTAWTFTPSNLHHIPP